MYAALQEGYKTSALELVSLSRNADPTLQKNALAFLAAEQHSFHFHLVSDRYLSPEVGQVEFLGFTIAEGIENRDREIFIPNIYMLTQEKRVEYHEALSRRTAAGYATMKDIGLTHLMGDEALFLPKEAMILGAERTMEQRLLHTKLLAVEKKVAKTIESSRVRAKGFMNSFIGRTQTSSDRQANLQRLFRKFQDCTCQAESHLFAEPMSIRIEKAEVDLLETRYHKYLNLLIYAVQD